MIEPRSRFVRILAAARVRLWRLRRVHPERYCHRCGHRNISWVAPSPLWNAVMRGGLINGDWHWHEIICPLCFAELGEAQLIASGWWQVSAREVHVELELITPSGRVWDAEARLWVDALGTPDPT